MFEIHVGDTPCQLSPKDYRTLAERTDGYSGSDISIVVRDALMQPIRKVISATHFKRVPDPESNLPERRKWTPCSPGDPEAEEKTWQDINSEELLEPPLKLADFVKSLEATRPTVTEADIKRHDNWTKESGFFFLSSALYILGLTSLQGLMVLSTNFIWCRRVSCILTSMRQDINLNEMKEWNLKHEVFPFCNDKTIPTAKKTLQVSKTSPSC